MGKTNKYLDLWRKVLMEHRRKHGGSLKEAMQSKAVKAEYERRKKSLGGTSRKASPRKSPRKTVRKSPRKTSPRKTSPRKMGSYKRRK